MAKILAIDGKKENLVTIAGLLKSRMPECAVIMALSGAEGIEKAQKEAPDVILLDIRMSGMDGFEVCRRLKADAITQSIPIIMLTASRRESQTRVKALDLGADAFLNKPIDKSELVSQIKVALRVKNAEDRLRAERDSLERIVQERTKSLQESEEAARRVAHENAVIAEIGRVISSSMKIEEVHEKFAASARQLLPFDRISIVLFNPEEKSATIAYTAGKAMAGWDEGTLFPLPGTFMEKVCQGRQSLLLQGKTFDEARRQFPNNLAFQPGFLAILAIPLNSRMQVMGGLFFYSTHPSPYTELHRQLGEGIANQIAGAVANARLFRECRQAEEWERLTRRTLELLNPPEGTTDTIRAILQLIKQSTNFEAAGIRLREGNDFPYYETNGFAEEFVKAEKYLCAHNKAGEIVRNGQGNPLLDCMCGNILSGRFDPTRPFFTAGGSFWTNSTTDLLAATTETERQRFTPTHCTDEGYESVGLIPLRSGQEIIGLLQLNDRRRNRFTPEMIRVMEGLGNSIGIALARDRSHEQIKASLKEKDVLLAEIHHRVKNNMQVISSLLRLQSRHIKDEELNKVFQNSQARIRTMALIHEKLYRSGDFSRIDLAGYIRELASSLYSSYGVKRERIGLKVQGEGIFLKIKEAVPCGLILNEVISNALKHAFPRGRTGEITIALEVDKGRIKIAVKDNGIGLAADLDFRQTTSLGLQLVVLLVEQLGGTIELHREGGTEFRISFPKE